jgi:hypothetical protein
MPPQHGCWPPAPSRGTFTEPTIMKKLLPSAILALVVSGLATVPSFAGCCFGLCYHHCGCCGCGAMFCVRQYNAFSPVCCGTVYCDGCCPFGPPGGGCGPAGCGLPFSGMPACGPGGCPGPCADGVCQGAPVGGGAPCGDGACLGSLPPSDLAPGAPASGAPVGAPTTVTNPVVSPSPLPSGPTSQAVVNDRVIQNASYRPSTYTTPSAPAPVRMQPQMMAAPSYWGN